VVVEQETTGPHRDHIVLHEISHLLLEHDSVRVLTDEASRQLLAHLDSTAIQRLIGRAGYDALEEQKAELLASLLHARIEAAPRRALTVPTEAADVVGRLGRCLDAGG
jgi:hypothetical protein